MRRKASLCSLPSAPFPPLPSLCSLPSVSLPSASLILLREPPGPAGDSLHGSGAGLCPGRFGCPCPSPCHPSCLFPLLPRTFRPTGILAPPPTSPMGWGGTGRILTGVKPARLQALPVGTGGAQGAHGATVPALLGSSCWWLCQPRGGGGVSVPRPPKQAQHPPPCPVPVFAGAGGSCRHCQMLPSPGHMARPRGASPSFFPQRGLPGCGRQAAGTASAPPNSSPHTHTSTPPKHRDSQAGISERVINKPPAGREPFGRPPLFLAAPSSAVAPRQQRCSGARGESGVLRASTGTRQGQDGPRGTGALCNPARWG